MKCLECLGLYDFKFETLENYQRSKETLESVKTLLNEYINNLETESERGPFFVSKQEREMIINCISKLPRFFDNIMNEDANTQELSNALRDLLERSKEVDQLGVKSVMSPFLDLYLTIDDLLSHLESDSFVSRLKNKEEFTKIHLILTKNLKSYIHRYDAFDQGRVDEPEEYKFVTALPNLFRSIREDFVNKKYEQVKINSTKVLNSFPLIKQRGINLGDYVYHFRPLIDDLVVEIEPQFGLSPMREPKGKGEKEAMELILHVTQAFSGM